MGRKNSASGWFSLDTVPVCLRPVPLGYNQIHLMSAIVFRSRRVVVDFLGKALPSPRNAVGGSLC